MKIIEKTIRTTSTVIAAKFLSGIFSLYKLAASLSTWLYTGH